MARRSDTEGHGLANGFMETCDSEKSLIIVTSNIVAKFYIAKMKIL